MNDLIKEEKILEDLKTLKKMDPGYRCLHIRSHLLEENKEEWPNIFNALKQGVLSDVFEEIYFCHDGDVLVTGRTLTHKKTFWIFPKLEKSLGLEAGCLAPVSTLFELGVHWPQLFNICQRKISMLKMIKAKAEEHVFKGPEMPEDWFECILSYVSPDMIENIDQRRSDREKPSILVVEDDPFSQKLVNNALRSDYEVDIKSLGQDGVKSYISKAPDILFLDINLPDVNGHELLQKIFSLDPAAFVVMFSGNGDQKNVVKAVELGAKGFVGKPFTPQKLRQYIEQCPYVQAKMKRV